MKEELKTRVCPNCGHPGVFEHPDDGCVLAALIGVLRDREDLSEEELLELHSRCDVDALWSDIGKVLDRLEEGFYSNDEDEEEA